MGVEKKVPQIRFKGFSGEWVDATLSDVIDVRSGKDYKHLGKGDIPVYGTGGYMLSVDSALSNNEDAVGIGRKGTIDKPYLLRAPFWTVDTLFHAVPKPKFNLDYLYCFFQKIDWKKHDESTGVPSLSKVAINNIPIRVTNEKEQTAIGNYFKKLDALINQHQQKHDRLCDVKKAMLEKMFPKQGETIPEIRFKGFSEEWRDTLLGHVSKIKTGSSNREDSGLDGKYIFFDRSEEIRTSDIYLFNCEAVIVAGEGSDFVPKYFIGKFDLHQRTYAIMQFDDSDGKYIFYYIHFYRKYFLDQAVGSTVKSLRLPMFEKMPIKVPEKREQVAIGNYFQKLDVLINQHQQQITKLNNIKRACLNKMFV